MSKGLEALTDMVEIKATQKQLNLLLNNGYSIESIEKMTKKEIYEACGKILNALDREIYGNWDYDCYPDGF